MEIYKYFGMTFNVVVAFDIFKKVNQASGKKKYSSQDHRNMYIVALQNLKYMGFVSATRQGTFSFRKNFFGKPIKESQGSAKAEEKDHDEVNKVLGAITATAGVINKKK